ncbi:DSD1 family PLP-dependent enzyme [Pikeienuella piscinae]|uniref:DSD1 family PLP-dependent enzyme n=1 Tax=Pikeienuella piscinae TaxID=2748098 RepID=A0A7M3T5L7_9RHOB|nr:DSD1 family PLP-dependent enzyme [Pikeienuella piscinae]QIE57298.1 DSD1 family PLP-dependent enzyme [Pikeienuella piscinae]
MSAPEVGYDIPATVGMAETEIETPALIVDLDAFERNIVKMRDFCAAAGVRLRAHGKMHKSADVAKHQISFGGSTGICCQKTAEAHAFARAGVDDILITNQVRGAAKIARLAEIAKIARLIVCCDDIANVAELSAAATAASVAIEVLVEIDCGAGRCGVTEPSAVVAIAKAIEAAPGLKFSGIQAYQGAMQHMERHEDRKAKFRIAVAMVTDAIAALKAEGIACETVSGGGTGSYALEAGSGVYTELQCGSYAFMDADYGRVLDSKGARLDRGEWENSLFILTSVMSHVKSDQAVCDAGLKAQSVDSGLPVIYGRDDVEYVECSDEHGVIADPKGALKINDRLRLVPGHCDPTCNLHDWYVGVRNGRVEALWPVTARGLSY